MKTLIEIRDILHNAGRFDLADAIDDHLSAQARVRVTDEDVKRALSCVPIFEHEPQYAEAFKQMRIALESFAARLSQGAQGDGSYVHVVPDKCDRVVWHNQYIHLTERAAVPDGWVLVPIDPTEDMLAQACTHDVQPRTEKVDQWNRDTWSFMLTAAPQPPEGALTKLQAQYDELRAAHLAYLEANKPASCATCHDGGVVRKDGFFGTTFEPCPDCTDKGE